MPGKASTQGCGLASLQRGVQAEEALRVRGVADGVKVAHFHGEQRASASLRHRHPADHRHHRRASGAAGQVRPSGKVVAALHGERHAGRDTADCGGSLQPHRFQPKRGAAAVMWRSLV